MDEICAENTRPRSAARIVRWSVLGVLAFPAIVFLALSVFARSQGLQMRIAAMAWLLMVPLGLLIIYSATWLLWWAVKRFHGGGQVKRGVRYAGFALVWLYVAGSGAFLIATALLMPSDHEVDFEGERAVGVVSDFDDVRVSYFEDWGPFFMGQEEIGADYYGGSGFDPLDREPVLRPKKRVHRGTLVFDETKPPRMAESDGSAQRQPGQPAESAEPVAPRSEEEQAAEGLAEMEAAFAETGSVYRVTGTVVSQIDSNTGAFKFRIDDGQGVLEEGALYRVIHTPDTRRLYGMKGLQWGMDGVVVGFAEVPSDNVLRAGVIIGNDDTTSAYWESR